MHLTRKEDKLEKFIAHKNPLEIHSLIWGKGKSTLSLSGVKIEKKKKWENNYVFLNDAIMTPNTYLYPQKGDNLLQPKNVQHI